jgi:hypothetical protein
MSHPTASMPDLRIVEIERLLAHEDHDSQRADPLIERLRHEPTIINPPIVAPLPGADFVILDGANRTFALRALGIPHMLVQVAPYQDGSVSLGMWRHVVTDWNLNAFLAALQRVQMLEIVPQSDAAAEPESMPLAEIMSVTGDRWLVHATGTGAGSNAPLRALVHVYQSQATLQRTTLDDLDQVWHYHPGAIALVTFRAYQPADIMRAALERDYLPPGVSRHIVQGRAVRVNYPMLELRDAYTPLERKNEALRKWTQEMIAARRVRYYAESTFQFDE